jgi:hypothetical protein
MGLVSVRGDWLFRFVVPLFDSGVARVCVVARLRAFDRTFLLHQLHGTFALFDVCVVFETSVLGCVSQTIRRKSGMWFVQLS